MRDWTFMVYMAGDNGKVFDNNMQLMCDLQTYGWRDLAEMSEVGSTDRVAIVAQYDTLENQQYTPCFFFDGAKPSGQLVETILPVNTGDPKNLTDFIVWGATKYPARRYALVLWNHGTGWKEDDIYANYRELIDRASSRGETRSGHRGEEVRSALFLITAGEIMSIEDSEARAICYDDSSKDLLDNQKLVDAFTNAEAQIGQRLSLLGMDACLMSMVEVAYQLRDRALVMVGSQENEPGDSWPYAAVLGALVGNPDMSPYDLGRHIVKSYGDYYMGINRDGGGDVTQSAVDLEKIAGLSQHVGAFARVLANGYESNFLMERALGRVLQDVQRFRGDRDDMDLHDFLGLLESEYASNDPVLEAIHEMQGALAEEAANHRSSPTSVVWADPMHIGCPSISRSATALYITINFPSPISAGVI